jgi:hypothetical protein
MLLNRREDPADLEKGLLLILFELEESRSSLVFRQAFDPVDETDNDVDSRRLGVDSVDVIVRQPFKNDFLGMVPRQGAYKPGLVFSADRESLIGHGFRHQIFHIAVLAPANSSRCERPLLEGGPTAFLPAPSQPSLAQARRIHMRNSTIIAFCGQYNV